MSLIQYFDDTNLHLTPLQLHLIILSVVQEVSKTHTIVNKYVKGM